ncbi:hypothetical protein ACFRLW_21155 [Streptomyces sp. NPDC056728]
MRNPFRRTSDAELAATRYAGRESATEKAARKRRSDHRSKGIARATREGDAWEEQDRKRFR